MPSDPLAASSLGKVLSRIARWVDRRFFRVPDMGEPDAAVGGAPWPTQTDYRSIFNDLWQRMRQKRTAYLWIVGMEAVGASATGGAVLVLKEAWGPLEKQQWHQAIVLLAIFLGINMIQLLANLGQSIGGNYLTESYLFEFRRTLLDRLLRFPMDFFARIDTGAVVNHFNADVGLTVQMMTGFFLSAISTAIHLVVVGGVVFWMNWKVGSLLFASFMLFAPLMRLARAKIGKFARRLFRLNAGLISLLQQGIYAIKYIKAMGAEADEARRITRILAENRTIGIKVAAIHQFLGPVMEFVYLLLICGSAVVTVAVLGNEVRMAVLVPMVYALFRVLRPLRQVSNAIIKMEEHLQAAQRLYGTFALPSEHTVSAGTTLTPPVDTVEFRNIRYSYGDNPVLDGVDLRLTRGTITALMGPSGIGKSTVCDLMMALYGNYQGQIRINGVDLSKIDTDSLRPLLGYVPQEPILIRGSIRDNLCYGNEAFGVADGDMRRALEAANAWAFVSRLPQGLDSPIGERGVTLSGGECQRICLARALLRRPQILILDEATSAMDVANEKEILTALSRLKADRLILIVSHRPTVLAHADVTYRIEAGKVVCAR